MANKPKLKGSGGVKKPEAMHITTMAYLLVEAKPLAETTPAKPSMVKIKGSSKANPKTNVVVVKKDR